LKLDEDYVNLIYEEEFEELQKIVQKQDIELVSQEEQDLEEVYEPEQYIEEEDQQEIIIEEISIEPQNLPLPPSLPSVLKIEPPPSPPSPRKIRIGGFFGQEVEVDSINKTNEIKIISSRETLVIKENLSITALRPPRKRESLKFCKICGSSVKNVIKCPNCGATID
jgi:rubrerythrin